MKKVIYQIMLVFGFMVFFALGAEAQQGRELKKERKDMKAAIEKEEFLITKKTHGDRTKNHFVVIVAKPRKEKGQYKQEEEIKVNVNAKYRTPNKP